MLAAVFPAGNLGSPAETSAIFKSTEYGVQRACIKRREGNEKLRSTQRFVTPCCPSTEPTLRPYQHSSFLFCAPMKKIDYQLPLWTDHGFVLFRLLPCASLVYM